MIQNRPKSSISMALASLIKLVAFLDSEWECGSPVKVGPFPGNVAYHGGEEVRLFHATPRRLVAEVGEVNVQVEVGGLWRVHLLRSKFTSRCTKVCTSFID